MLRPLLACIWVLMLAVVLLADQGADTDSGGLNVVALCKLGSRLGPLCLIAWVMWSSRETLARSSLVWQVLPWGLFAAWAVVSFSWSALPSVSLGQSLSLVILLTLSCCIALHSRRIAHVSEALAQLSILMLLVSVVVLVAKFTAPDLLSLSRDGKGAFHPTNAAGTAGLAIVLVTAARCLFGWKWSRWLFAPSLLVHGATLALANNRASLLITALVVVLLVLWSAAPQSRWLLVTGACMALAAYLVADPALRGASGLSNRLAEYLARNQSAGELAALSGREEMWSVIWTSYLRSPWIGHGYFVSSASGKLKVWYLWSNWTAHNFWLQVLVSTGIVGAGLMAWSLLGYVARLLQAGKLPTGSRKVAALGALALIWQCGWGLTNESFVGPLQAESIAFFTVFGLVIGRLVIADDRADERSSSNSSPVRQRDFAPALATGSF